MTTGRINQVTLFPLPPHVQTEVRRTLSHRCAPDLQQQPARKRATAKAGCATNVNVSSRPPSRTQRQQFVNEFCISTNICGAPGHPRRGHLGIHTKH